MTTTVPRTSERGLGVRSSWAYKNSLLLVVESDLTSRFPYIEEVVCGEKYVLPFRTVIKRNLLSTLMARLGMKRELSLAYDELKNDLCKYQIVLLSNTEGFIARNIARWIRRDFPNLVLVSLQHGMFMLENDRARTALVLSVNKLTEAAMDYSVAGGGFIHEAVDFYIVYNNWYKSLLVERGVPSDRIIVSSVLLKGKQLFEGQQSYSPDKRTAVFLLQCLSALAITDKQSEVRLVDCVVKWLSTHYDMVLLKQHPYCNIEITGLPSNCRVVGGDLIDIAKQCGTAVSFFSVALLECEFLGLQTIAIRRKGMNVRPDVYRLFDVVADVEDDGSMVFSKNVRKFSSYYESDIRSAEELFAVVGASKAGTPEWSE